LLKSAGIEFSPDRSRQTNPPIYLHAVEDLSTICRCRSRVHFGEVILPASIQKVRAAPKNSEPSSEGLFLPGLNIAIESTDPDELG
jgi:hypothetical protein